ncbi:ABC transporter family protein (macronuclear) [Tetrahymena thermophila SB210]|uniref:ABC transporter family protein n=1 Tax=Tetrahymena thermophila (strain SB210) TaxID=312017 RepID=I7LXH0_TETTS|nr:ABC transporter family protein [Tetrahymena thermophila SB210]EAS04625.2 ABC transporter family protein [Tetrahymena thermophila SB210]|eukprot:XP_001024870.2 ABC transporter family protein [Tetrahymena thermophila SB210]
MEEKSLQNLEKPTQNYEDQEVADGKIPFWHLFKLASKTDIILVVLGSLASVINGCLQPLFGLLFGEMAQKFSPGYSADAVVDNCRTIALWFVGIGAISFILSIFMMYFWISVGQRQAIKFRLEYFKSLLKQEVGYFDQIQANELSSKVSTECFKIQSALGEKTCIFIYSLSMFIGSLIIAFIRGWQIALVAIAVTPLIASAGYFDQWVSEGIVKKTSSAYSSAGGISEQAISAIRTVKGLNGQDFEQNKYQSMIKKAFQVSLKFSIYEGVGLGLQNMMFFFDFALTFWVGSKFIEDEVYNHNQGRSYNFSDVLTAFLAIMMSSFELGQAMNSIKAFTQARQAGFNMFQILNRKSKVDLNENGIDLTKKQINGEIKFENVDFSYPTHLDTKILKNLNISIQPHKKTAFVGESGSGKSTIVQLIERFYDPQFGNIYLDGVNLKDFKLTSLRQSIGYVGQEPVLFATTIRENLLYGKRDATEEQMIEALKQANAWQFIEKLEKGLDTYVGTSGAQFSGGQKQRISIARAILKNPKILLLDEATSALDRKNEAQIQSTLDSVSKGLTTIVVAHRLSTIQNSDEIIVLDKGVVVERGTHDDLLKNNGAYFKFVEKQKIIEKEQEKQAAHNNKTLCLLGETQSRLASQSSQTLNTEQEFLMKQESQNQNCQKLIQQFQNLNNIKEEDDDNDDEEAQNKAIRSSFSSQTQNTPKQIEIVEQNIIDLQNIQNTNVKQAQEKTNDQGIMKRLFSYNEKQTINYVLGFLFAIGNGVCYPFSGYVLGKISDVLLDRTRSDFREQSNLQSLYFLILGLAQLLTCTFQFYFFSRVAEQLTFKLRKDLFQKYLKMPISWFDHPHNTPGSLTQKLSTDCQAVNNMTSSTLGIQLSNVSSLVSALALAFSADWRTTLVGLSLMPLMVLSQAWYMSRMEGFGEKTDAAFRDSTNMINEAACNIRTVTSFGNNQQLVQNFTQILDKNIKEIKKSALEAGLAIACTNFILFAIYGTIFYAGSTFHRDYDLSIVDMFISIQCLMFAAIGIGSNSHYLGDVGTSQNAAKGIFQVLDSVDENQLNILNFDNQDIHGEIQFKNVTFKYPQRDQIILKDVSFTIPAGQKVAFVGPSGAGKSSIIQLIQRFYDNYQGEILLDGVDIKNYDLLKYRSKFGVVSQEPTLFTGTIKENIIYNTENVNEQQIESITKQVNAYDFITNYSKNGVNGFDRQVGLKGNQLSGGQKQRIAICRAMIKQPKIMLLDEATSALDSQNEKIVQESLNEAMKQKTSICVAHRISTIKDSDMIYVMENGNIVEQGKYDQLMNLKNNFYKLQLGSSQ